MLLGLAPALPDANSWAPDGAAPSKMKLPDLIVGGDGVARLASPGSSLLDKFLPVTHDAKGNARIYGLPPAIAYSLVALTLGGSAYYAYRAWGKHVVRLVNPKPKKRGRPRGRSKC